MTQQEKYNGRFQKVIKYIEDNLDENLSLEVLCNVANFSKYHFHRQFTGFTGMTLSKFIARKRMKRAAYQLLFRTDISIINIAFDAGYSTPEAFSKSFNREFGVSPSQFRKDNHKINQLDELNPLNLEELKDMDISIIIFKKTRIAALEHVGAPNKIMNSVQKFINWRRENHLPPQTSRTFNIFYNDPSNTAPEDYRMDIAAELKGKLKENTDDIIEKQIPECECAYLRHIGPWNTLENSIRHLYNDWLPNSDRELLDFPLFVERVNLYPETPEHQLITDIYLPLKK
ncbi:AraC family transcriptional regulator [Pseudemcibacter aquimaris]|uniref:AraC family transcriptional regulator n=1 Tax=Pseudemcibacter aquimaris TaxID=2857064 RepID=UPI0020128906|nr:AraC family transcriptional regulator [Pseudemcibacter aquimaris]MCC3860648.1 AraC family transcriptional regulator [Pseudemcibacter aquimaris]WDU59467.1 AraC family transcriptional regulator [Pseudemcibacter aquimaris]